MEKKKRQTVYEKYDGCCAYCGREIEFKDMQVDHFVPQRLGGTDGIDNLMPSCRLCNHYKRANKIETFRNMIEKIPEKMHSNYIYKVGLAYENITESKKDIKFYYEWKKERRIKMTNKEKFITMLKDEDDYAIGLLECPPTCDDGCPSGADGELISCDTCKKMWLGAEVE